MKTAFPAAILLCGLLCISGCGGDSSAPPPSRVIGQYIGIFNDAAVDNFNPILAKNPPFDLWDITFIAFLHTFPHAGAYVVDFENARGGGAPNPGDTDGDRVAKLIAAARKKNPAMKFVISLGYGSSDLANAATTPEAFADSVVKLLQDNDLDGFDIDYEEINTLEMSDEAFRILITTIRNRLDQTGKNICLS